MGPGALEISAGQTIGIPDSHPANKIRDDKGSATYQKQGKDKTPKEPKSKYAMERSNPNKSARDKSRRRMDNRGVSSRSIETDMRERWRRESRGISIAEEKHGKDYYEKSTKNRMVMEN
jgi:hypothetical protein